MIWIYIYILCWLKIVVPFYMHIKWTISKKLHFIKRALGSEGSIWYTLTGFYCQPNDPGSLQKSRQTHQHRSGILQTRNDTDQWPVLQRSNWSPSCRWHHQSIILRIFFDLARELFLNSLVRKIWLWGWVLLGCCPFRLLFLPCWRRWAERRPLRRSWLDLTFTC